MGGTGPDGLPRLEAVADVVYNPFTALLQQAEALGVRCVNSLCPCWWLG